MSELFTVDSSALPASARVAGFHGRERLSEAYELDVWLLVSDADASALDAESVLLQSAGLLVHRDDGGVRWSVRGVWSSLELVHEGPGGDSLYRAVLVPTFWKLKLSRHSRVWVNKSIPDIIEATLRAAGMTASQFELRLSASYAARPHVCQYRESDFDFVARWCEREGIYWYFEHDDAGDKLVMVDDKGRHERFGDGVLRMVPEAIDGSGSGVEGFRALAQREVYVRQKYELRDHDALRPRVAMSGDATVDGAHRGVARRHDEDNFATARVGARLATVRAEQDLAARSVVRGVGRALDARTGFKFELHDHPRASLDREYLVVEVTHRGRQLPGDHALSRHLPLVEHREYDATVLAIPADVQFRAPFSTPAPRATGIEIATVDGAMTSDYAQLDEHGRYLVRMRFDENDTPAGESSTRIRMLQPHAGAPEGFHLPLRKGTEVMVIFVGGDPDRALISGAVPNADTPSPVTSSNHTQNVIHTGGDNRFEIEDDAARRYIDIRSPPEDTRIHLGAHHDGHQHNYISSTDGNGLIHTGGTLDVTVGGKKHEHVKGTVTETYHASQTTETKLTVTENYHADMETTVTGAVQETYKSHTTHVTNKTIERCASQLTTVTGHLEEHHGHQHTLIDGRLYVKSGTHNFVAGTSTCDYGDMVMNASASFTINSSGPVRINALNWQDNAPISYRIVTNVKRVIHNASKAVIYPLTIELVTNKTSQGTFALSLNRAKGDVGAIAIAMNGFKFDYTKMKIEMVAQKIKPIPLNPGGKATNVKKFAISFLG